MPFVKITVIISGRSRSWCPHRHPSWLRSISSLPFIAQRRKVIENSPDLPRHSVAKASRKKALAYLHELSKVQFMNRELISSVRCSKIKRCYPEPPDIKTVGQKQEKMTIRRFKLVLLAFLGGYGLLLVIYFLHLLGVIYIQGASTWIARGFILCFILPAFVYFCFLWSKRDLFILRISDDEVELRSGFLINRSLRIPRSSIEKVTTNWDGPNSDSPADLIFLLRSDASSIAKTSSVLNLKKSGWHFDLSTADISPYEAVRLIKTHLAI